MNSNRLNRDRAILRVLTALSLSLCLLIPLAACSGDDDQPPNGNQPPNVIVEIGTILPNRIDVHAHESIDPDGHIHHFLFHLEDHDTGDLIAYATTFQDPTGNLVVPGPLPPVMRVLVTALDNDGGIGTASATVSLESTDTCVNDEFTCTKDSSNVVCVPNGNSSTTNFSIKMVQLLRAAYSCEGSIDGNSTLVIQATGGEGGDGAHYGLFYGGYGGSGGFAQMTTSIAGLPDPDGSYCYGLGEKGSADYDHSASGGASTILRTCGNANQSSTTGVLLIAGGGGGGQKGQILSSGTNGHSGGSAYSTTSGPCPPDCVNPDNDGGGGGQEGGGGGVGGYSNCFGGFGYSDIGGRGGKAEGKDPVGWWQGDPLVEGTTGEGGDNTKSHINAVGAGGGGYGGGGVGGGGGGGGSYAAMSTRANDSFTDTSYASVAGKGALVFIFPLE